MKTRQSRRQTTRVSHSRWLAYATAGAATALAGTNSAEAAIHYSGVLREHFPPDKGKTMRFPLDQAGDSLLFGRSYHPGSRGYINIAFFTCFGIASGAFRGPHATGDQYYAFPSKLRFGQNISTGSFTCCPYSLYGVLAGDYFVPPAQWNGRGTGFVGFAFNSGAGVQYGWARVRMVGDPENAFTVLDYAYADPGERIRAGQTSRHEMVPDEGSLGWLAVGAVGLLAWRKNRSRIAS